MPNTANGGAPRARIPRRRFWIAAVLVSVPILGFARLKRDLEPGILDRRGSCESVRITEEIRAGGCLHQRATLRSTSGLEVDLAIRRPAYPMGNPVDDPVDAVQPPRMPLALLLGGYETGRDAIRLVPDAPGLVLAALSYPYRGARKPKGLSFLLSIPAIQDGIRDTPSAVLLALDWLAAQPWVDPARIELVGVSLGAPFACIAGALDPRFARVWSLHGAGSLDLLLEHSLRKKIPFLPARKATAWLAWLLAYGDSIAPERWVARIAPRPFVMVNARGDERLPRAAIERLYESAREPKEIIWTEGAHVEPERHAVVQDLVDTVLARIAAAAPGATRTTAGGAGGAGGR